MHSKFPLLVFLTYLSFWWTPNSAYTIGEKKSSIEELLDSKEANFSIYSSR